MATLFPGLQMSGTESQLLILFLTSTIKFSWAPSIEANKPSVYLIVFFLRKGNVMRANEIVVVSIAQISSVPGTRVKSKFACS